MYKFFRSLIFEVLGNRLLAETISTMRCGSFLSFALTVGLVGLFAHSYLDRPKLSVQRDLDWLVFAHSIGLFHLWAFLVLIILLLNVVTGEVSWVDRLWSVLPPCSAWLIALKRLPILPSQAGVRPDFLRDVRQSALKDLPYDKRNPFLVTLQMFFFSLKDVVSSPRTSGAKILNGLQGNLSELPVLGIVAATVITIWGLRLSYNFWRKGGYWLGGEDYRWIRVRQWFGMIKDKNGKSLSFFGDGTIGRLFGSWVVFPLFNISFICAFQLWLLVIGLTGPLLHRLLVNPIINTTDVALLSSFLILLGIETVADQQQWNFHQRKGKVAMRPEGKDMLKDAKFYESLCDEIVGFTRSGLFSISRHPNFAAEMAMWWVVFLVSVSGTIASSLTLYNASVFGAVSLTAIFLGSTPLTEALSTEKYGLFYEVYKTRVSRLVPFL